MYNTSLTLFMRRIINVTSLLYGHTTDPSKKQLSEYPAFRKMSYRHQSATSGDNFHYNTGGSHQSAASHHRNFRRYGPQTDIERRAVLALIAREREAQMQAQASESYMQSDMRADGKFTSFFWKYARCPRKFSIGR